MKGLRVSLSVAIALAVCVVSAMAWASESSPPAVGAKAPDFTLKDGEGAAFTLSASVRSGPVVVVFFSKAFTKASIRQWEGLREAAPSLAKAGVQLVGMSTDSMSTLKRFAAAHRLPFRLLSDGTGEVSERYGAIYGFAKRRVTAQKAVVVGTEQTILYRDERYEAKTPSDLRALLRAAGVK